MLKLPPVALLRERYHYNPLTGSLTYLQSRGPRRIGDEVYLPAQGKPTICVNGIRYSAGAIVWYMHTGSDPGPLHVHPRDGNPLNLRSDNLFLAAQPFARTNKRGRSAGRPMWMRGGLRYRRDTEEWEARYRCKLIGRFSSRAEAIAAKRLAREDRQQSLGAVDA